MTRLRVPYPASGAWFDADDAAALAARVQEMTVGTGSFFPYPEQGEFCESLQTVTGGGYIVPVSSCAAAIGCLLRLHDVGPGDEVITTPLTFVATASEVMLTGAKVVFADVDPRTMNLDPRSVRAHITARTKAILPVHFAGMPSDVEGFEQISRETGIPVIYDTAHALGAHSAGQPICRFGTANCLSFQISKHVTCLGEGGAIVCESQELAEAAMQYKSFGFSYPRRDTFDGGTVVRIGTNLQMTKLQFFAGTLQLRKFAARQAVRQDVFLRLRDALSDIEEIELPDIDPTEHACLLFVIRMRDNAVHRGTASLRDALQRDFGIETRLHYDPLWEWPALKQLGYDGADCPHAADASRRLVTLPVSVGTTDEQCDYLNQSIRKCFVRR